MASYITTVARITERANAEEPIPSRNAAEAARAHTVAEWELGMPPVSQNRLRQSSPARIESRMVLRTCARNQDRMAEESSGLMLSS